MQARPWPAWRWDLFCRVVDNYGDLGVCWRLASDLVRHGQTVRLWVDDPALAARMVQPRPGLELVAWGEPAPDLAPGDVVVEAFGCDPPPGFIAAMACAATPPVWINLEYLTAEAHAGRCHRLPSPQLSGPGRGLTKWFYYPGFFEDTGGLILEADLLHQQQTFDRLQWLARWGAPPQPGERVVALFGYPSAPLDDLLRAWATQPRPTWLLAAWGELQDRAQAWQKRHPESAAWLRITPLPWLTQDDFDALLWSADLNLVRGEDSLVRALWAGKPFIWQLYAQEDGAHEAKLAAFTASLPGQGWLPAVLPAWRAWNGLQAWPAQGDFGQTQPGLTARWQAAVAAWRQALAARTPLTTGLIAFVAERRSAG